MEKPNDTALLYSFQQATLDERQWFELYNNLLNYGNQTTLTHANSEMNTILAETLEFKEQVFSQWRLFNHIFDSLPVAILFLDSDYHILHYNKKATPLYYQSEFQQFLTQLHHEILSTSPNKKSLVMADDLSYHNRLWQHGIYRYYLSLIAYHDHPQVRYIVYAFRDKPQLNISAISQQFNLTEGEGRTLQATLEYGNSKDAAQQLDTSHETIRSHIKNILRKTQTHSQNELIMKLFSGSYWLGEIQAFHEFAGNDNKQLLMDLVHEPFVILGKNLPTKQGHLTLIIPSFFGVVWDLIEENAIKWQRWCEAAHCPLVIINTHQIIPKSDWKTQDLPELCHTIATQLQAYIAQHYPQVDSISLIGVHTGTGFALNLAPYLPYNLKEIKLISPILPLPYMHCEQVRHAEYHSAAKAQKIPKKIWYAVMPYIVDSATKDS